MYVPFISVMEEESREESKPSKEPELFASGNSEKLRSNIRSEEVGAVSVLLPIPDGDDDIFVIFVVDIGVTAMPDTMMIVAKVNRVAVAMMLYFLFFLLLIDIVLKALSL